MKKIFFFIACMTLTTMITIFPGATFGSDDWNGFAVKPALSIGYLHTLGNTSYSLAAHAGGLGGVVERTYDYDAYPSVYLEGKIPFMIGKRLEVVLSGSWAIPAGASEVANMDYNPPGALLGGRTWDSKTNWLTANLQVSYAVVKNFHWLKSLAPIVGFRYDYGKTSFNNPHKVSPGFAAAAPTDTADFNSSALQQYFGVAAILGDFKIGSFGGDLKLSAIGGWTPWGKVSHDEYRNGGPSNRYDQFSGHLDKGNYFVEIGAEYTMFSFAIAQRAEGSISVFTKYNLFHATSEMDGVRSRSGAITELDTFDFKLDRSSVALGLTGAIKF